MQNQLNKVDQLSEYMDYFIDRILIKHELFINWMDLEYEKQMTKDFPNNKKVYRFTGKHLVMKNISHGMIIHEFKLKNKQT